MTIRKRKKKVLQNVSLLHEHNFLIPLKRQIGVLGKQLMIQIYIKKILCEFFSLFYDDACPNKKMN